MSCVVPPDGMFGRRKIISNASEITRANVLTVLGKALPVHNANVAEINYLYGVYRGKQDVRHKTKVVRPEINNRVVLNRANQIVTFKTGFFLEGPIQYVSAGGNRDVSDVITTLNSQMEYLGKEPLDKEILDWVHICGVGVRMCLPNKNPADGEPPFLVYAIDPRDAFVIYSGRLGNPAMAGVLIQKDAEDKTLYCIYTESEYFEVSGNQITRHEPHTVPYIPMIEYSNNMARLGAFETVLSPLNMINTIESNRVDSIQDFVNAFDVFQNCELADGQYSELAKGGMAIQVSSQPGMEAKVYRIASELNQQNAQTIVDDLTETILTIVGMPNRNGGTSTSDNMGAVIFRDGWSDASSRADDTQKMWDLSEREFLKIVFHIARETGAFDLQMSDVKIEHTRNNLANMQTRMQILCEGLNNDKIHPKIPWIVSGMPNAEEWYQISNDWYEQKQAELAETLTFGADGGTDENAGNSTGDSTSNSTSNSTGNSTGDVNGGAA